MTDLTQRLAALGVEAGKVDQWQNGAKWRMHHQLPPFNGPDMTAIIDAADAALEELVTALEEMDELDSYNGHLKWMDKHYPLDVPYFAESEDVGCQVMRLSRKVMEAERLLAEREAEIKAMRGTIDSQTAIINMNQPRPEGGEE